MKISRGSQLNHLLSQYTSNHINTCSKKRVAAPLHSYSRCNLSPKEGENVLTLVSFTINSGFGIQLRHLASEKLNLLLCLYNMTC